MLLDGHSLAYRAFFALPVGNFSTTTGQPTNAVYGFTAMLINVLRDEQPTHIAVAWDLAAPTFRHEAYAAYKAGRQEAPAEFRGQVSLVKEVCEALAIPMVSAPGYEADDVIATLATRAEAEGMDVLIVTGDRDALQLVDDRVTVLMTRRGISEMTRFTPQEVRDRYGLTPQQYPDFAALRGDPSDNLPSVPGVGEKTAARWIQQFGSLGELVDRVDQVPGKAGDALREHLADVVRNRTLTELSRDVPLDVGPHDLHLGQWDREAVHQLFDTLQFRVLRERLYATLSAVEPEADRGFDVDARVLSSGEVAEWLAEHARGGARVGLHARGTWGRGTGMLTGLALAVEGGAGAWVDPTRLTAEDETALARWLADPGPPKAAHDVKGPLLALHAHGWELAGLASDTALAAYLALPGQRSFDLADLALRYLRRELRAEAPATGQLSLDGADEEDGAAADVVRARAVADLARALDAELERRSATALLHDVELPLVHVLAGMEEAGIAADAEHLAHLEAHYGGEVKDVAQQAYDLVGREFNLGSPKQLQQVLFDELGLPKTKRIKTGYTTDAEALTNLHKQTEHPLLAHLLRHR
ncbi:MAG TPA: DNA polymerase, partial [Frankiaceae bacterium]|nr:DNA polymerase [Frankiaceae bacterium]